jgi:predicted nucleic-acid-binding protein
MKKKSSHEEGNPRLKATFLQIVDNQLKANDFPETRQTLERLIAQGISREDAKLYIAQAVCVEVFNVMKHNQPSDHARYVRNLQRLPEEPQE